MTHVLVVASTFPASDTDAVPAFVKDQVQSMKKVDSSLRFTVLAPHDSRSRTKNFTAHTHYDEYRFHYAWPHKLEKLTGRGIMPTLQANPLYYFLIPALFVGELVALYSLTRKLKPDLLYAHWFTPQAIVARTVGVFTRTPFVFTTHASDVSVWHKIPVIGTVIVRQSARRAVAFTAVSTRSMAKLASFFSDKEWGQLKAKAKIIPMGIDLPHTSFAEGVNNKTILFVGRLAEKKGVQYLLPAFKDLLSEIPDVHLTIAGDGPWLARLKQQVDTLGIGQNVTFSGYVTGSAKQELIDSHAVYIVPSIITDDGDAEGLPVSLMEGLAAGKICIATHESGADDILTHNKDGMLIPQKDTAAITDALRDAVKLDKTKRQSISQRAQKTARQFSWPVIAKQHIDFFIKDVK